MLLFCTYYSFHILFFAYYIVRNYAYSDAAKYHELFTSELLNDPLNRFVQNTTTVC